MINLKDPSVELPVKSWRWRISLLIASAFTAYVLGFFALGLGYRAESDTVRTATGIIDGNIYWPLIHVIKDSVPGVRAAVVMRFRIFCVGAEKRCRVIEE